MSVVTSLLALSAITLFVLFSGRPPTSPKDQSKAPSVKKHPDAIGTFAGKESLPHWAWACIAFALSLAVLLWYQQDGKTSLRLARMTSKWQPLIDRVKFTGSAALPAVPAQSLPLFCQLLQRQTDRNDSIQLRALADCYGADSQFARAEPVYERLRRKHPNDPETILLWAQSKLFAHPDAPPQDALAALHRSIAQDPENLMARLLLASVYTRSGHLDAAKPLWDRLKRDTPRDHPLYALVAKTAAESERKRKQAAAHGTEIHITLNVPQAIVDRASEQSRLFVFVTRPGKAPPIVVKALPLTAKSRVTLRDSDILHKKKFTDYRQLEVHAKVTGDGKAMGEALASAVSSPFSPAKQKTLTLKLLHD